MKECGKCKKIYLIEKFSWKNKSKNLRHSWCKKCFNEARNKHYRDNPEYYKTKAKKHDKIYEEKNKKNLVEFLKNKCCVDCGISDIRVFQFDHVRDKKRYNIARGLYACSWNTLFKEIEKCDIVCANCHQIRTAERRGNWYRTEYLPD